MKFLVTFDCEIGYTALGEFLNNWLLKTRYFQIISFFLLVASSSLLGQVDCGYGFSYSVNTPYQALVSSSTTTILASGAAQPENINQLSATDEDIFPNQPLGFSFNFNGHVYTHCGVSTNGWIWFGDVNPVKAAGVVIPFTNILDSDVYIKGIVSALNGDLEGRWTADLSTIKTRTEGFAPNRIFTIEWNNFKALDDAEGTGYCGDSRNRFDFQIKLQENGNQISFAYNTAPYCWQGYNQLFQVGLRGESRSDVHTRLITTGNESWANSTLGLSNSTAILKSSNQITLPAQNARFTFYPASSEDLTWIGNDNNWFNPQNWTGQHVPNRCNNVNIPSGKSHYPELEGSASATCGNLTINEGASLTIKHSYSSFLTCFGNLINNGVISNNTSSFISLGGGANNFIGGTGYFLDADLFITAHSDYQLQNDLIVRNISINQGSSLKLNDKILNVYSIRQLGNIDQGTGILVIEGDAANVLLTDSTFIENNGTTFFGNGEVWSNQVNQIVPSLSYNHLWIRTNKNYTVQLGTSSDFSCKNLYFYNPGEPGGIAFTQRNITVTGDFKIGIDSVQGTDLQLNHTINRIAGSGSFAMGKNDKLTISHASTAQQTALSGFANPNFKGLVNYTGNSQQTLIKGSYSNVDVHGNATRFIQGRVNLRGILKLNDGILFTHDSLNLKSDSIGTALISGAGSGTVQGEVSAERYISGLGMQEVLLSSAFNQISFNQYEYGSPVLGVEGLEWNLPSNTSIWNYTEVGNWEIGTAGSLLEHMRGYKIFEMAGNTIRGKGLINSGIQEIALVNAGDNSGFNLVGNPYPSPIDWNKTASNLPVSICKSIYTKGKSTRFNGQFATWLPIGLNEGLGINGASQYIGMQEGFFVRAFESDTLRFLNEHRADIINPQTIHSPTTVSSIRLSLEFNTHADETVIYYAPNANSNQTTDGQDALKLEPGNTNSYWYSLKDSVRLAIQGRRTATNADSIPLSVFAAESAMFRLKLSDIANFPSTAMIFLEDRETNTLQNLRIHPIYSIWLDSGIVENRFSLHYKPGVEINASNEGCNGGEGQITLNNPTNTLWDVEVYASNDSLVAQTNSFSGTWNVAHLKADEYRVHFVLNSSILETDDWVQVDSGSYINAAFHASQTELLVGEDVAVFTNTSNNAQELLWDLGDGTLLAGTPQINHIFNVPGIYPVVLTASRNECSDTAKINISVVTVTGITQVKNEKQADFSIFPNPASDIAWLKLNLKTSATDASLAIIDALGRIVYQKKYSTLNPTQLIELPVNQLAKGNYQVVLNGGGIRCVNSLIVSGKLGNEQGSH
jgi:PKD repeat protein